MSFMPDFQQLSEMFRQGAIDFKVAALHEADRIVNRLASIETAVGRLASHERYRIVRARDNGAIPAGVDDGAGNITPGEAAFEVEVGTPKEGHMWLIQRLTVNTGDSHADTDITHFELYAGTTASPDNLRFASGELDGNFADTLGYGGVWVPSGVKVAVKVFGENHAADGARDAAGAVTLQLIETRVD